MLCALCLLAAIESDAIVYKSEPRDLVYDRYDALSEGERAGRSRPAIVFYHGGGWVSGNRNQFQSHSEHLASLGMVAFTVEYRLKKTDGVLAVDCVRDAWDAWEHIVAHADEYGIDPDHIAVGGGSAGGHLAACLGTGAFPPDDPRDEAGVAAMPSAMVLFNPGVCMAPFEGYEPKSWDRGTVARMGVEPVELSPMHHLDKSTPPTLIVHGTADDVISIRSASLFVERLQQYGTKAELKAYPNRGHGFFNWGRSDMQDPESDYHTTMQHMTQFLRELGYVPETTDETTDGTTIEETSAAESK